MSSMSPFREDVETAFASEHEGLYGHGAEFPVGAPAFPEAPSLDEWEEFEESEESGWAPELSEAEAAHPLLAVFPVAGPVIGALSRGLSSLAVRLAAGDGYKDVNQLTNIVFYFRHPERIGRRIEAGERDLAAEWISIRDQIVKPALQASPSGTPPADVPGPPVATGTPTGVRPATLSSSRLVWPDSSADELAFMKAVYDRHADQSKGDFVVDLPPSALDPIEGHEARKDAAQAATVMLAQARAALAIEHPRARIGILSAYRTAAKQFAIWQGRNPKGKDKGSGFPYYYREAIEKGVVRAGDFSSRAVERVAEYLGGYIASPGYSNHQDGLAFDFGVGEVGKGLGKLRSGSWFHRWLEANAKRFRPLATEAWHWTYTPPGAGESEVWASEVASPAVRANRVEVERLSLLARHRGNPPDLILRWNDMPSVPEEIDVVVHLHGFWYAGMKLPRDIEPVSGLDLAPAEGSGGQGRSRPTLTVLPRAHDTGVKQKIRQKDGTFKAGYSVLTFPALIAKDGLPELVRLSLDRFAAETGGRAPRVGRLILTAHSGGGKALLEILKHHDPHQVHVFDALYWPPGPLVNWARTRIRRDRAALADGDAAASRDYMASRGGALRVFYQGRIRGGTKPYSRELLEALSPELGAELSTWYRVEASKYDHFQIPRRYGPRVLADASTDVPDAYIEKTGRKSEHEAGPEGSALQDDLQDYDFEALVEAPLNDLPEPISEAPHDESLEPDWESSLWETDDGESEELDEVLESEDFDDVVESVDFDEVEDGFDGAEVVESPYSENEEADEWGVESREVELGEVDAFLENLDSAGLTFDHERPTTVTFPSSAALRVVAGATGPGEEHHDPNGSGNPLLDTSAAVRATKLSTSFTVAELARSGRTSFDKARIDPELVRSLQKLRDHVGKSVHVTSGYRPYLYNVQLYTSKYKSKPTLSRHSSGQAADVKIAGMTGMQIAQTAIDVLGPEIAVGIGGDFAHIDVRGQWARWTYFTDRQQIAHAIADIDAYRQRRARAGASAPPPAHAPPAGVRFREVNGKGWAAYGGGRLDESLRRLARSGSISISERDIDTLQRIADVESSGLTNALNSWDNAVMSIAFKQWTLRWGELQDLISRAPEAFARHSIRLAPPGTNYVFASKGKTWTQRAIDGVPDKEALRSEEWGRRFFVAALEPEAVAAAARKALEEITKLEQSVRTRYGWSPHLDSPRGRALLAELDNNRPAYIRDAVPRTLARAKEQPGMGEDTFLETFVSEIVAAYKRREGDADKGERWTRKTMGR